ncbi:MAG TPA: hypothetical protein VM537_27055 [Anaerolineae bacterium]|nr:hypothetical protein [Anaerolineae bacterium]
MNIDRWEKFFEGKVLGDRYITCPYCGHVDHDAWDGGYPLTLGEDAEEVDCPKCERAYMLSMNQAYTSEKMPDDEEEAPDGN